MLKKIQVDSLKLIDLHRVSNGFSPRKHISYRRYIYRLRVANTYEIYEKCLKEPSISCFAERNHSWTLPPNFDFHRANEICKKMEGTHNMGSFFKASKKIWNSLNPSPTYTYRTMNLVRVTPGSPICDFPDESFSYYNFEVVSRSFLREQVDRRFF
jgi:tRNA U38,U39,U40 pseudouridine synthase TruA